MPRTALYSADEIIESTSGLVAADGPASITMAGLANILGMPTGSIYHRFASRDVLLGEVWLRAAEAFQETYFELLAQPDAWQAGRAAALHLAQRVRQRPVEARILLLHRREDFFTSAWPDAMIQRAKGLKTQTDQGMRAFTQRLLGRRDANSLHITSFAVLGAPFAAVRPYVQANKTPPAIVDDLIRTTYRAIMEQAGALPTA